MVFATPLIHIKLGKFLFSFPIWYQTVENPTYFSLSVYYSLTTFSLRSFFSPFLLLSISSPFIPFYLRWRQNTYFLFIFFDMNPFCQYFVCKGGFIDFVVSYEKVQLSTLEKDSQEDEQSWGRRRVHSYV